MGFLAKLFGKKDEVPSEGGTPADPTSAPADNQPVEPTSPEAGVENEQ